MITVDTKILAYGKSKHAGQSGTVVADYGNYLLVEATDQKYTGAHKNSIGDSKYFQVDIRYIREVKD